MYARVLIDGRSYDKEELEAVLKMMLPTKYPELWDTYFKAWSVLDARRKSRK